MSKKHTLLKMLVQNGKTEVEIEGVGPIWRDPGRNSAVDDFNIMQNGCMATHLVPKRCDLGSLGVPDLASTPWAGGDGKTIRTSEGVPPPSGLKRNFWGPEEDNRRGRGKTKDLTRLEGSADFYAALLLSPNGSMTVDLVATPG